VSLNVLYFAWVKEKVGTGEEQVSPSDDVQTVADVIEWLKTQSPGHADAFADASQIRVALDQLHVPFDTFIGNAKEIAFFPPVTGGDW
jgi:sulfur-carrier protein